MDAHVTTANCEIRHRYSVWQALGFGAAVSVSLMIAASAWTMAGQALSGVEKIEAVMSERSKAVDVQAETVKAQLDLLNTKIDRLSEEIKQWAKVE